MKYDYYAHESRGYINDYFGDIGRPVKISKWAYIWLKFRGFRVTKVRKNSNMVVVMAQALLNDGIHPKCYKWEVTLNEIQSHGS